MSDFTVLAAIQQQLTDLEAISFVAHRDSLAALPAIQQAGDAVALEWLHACQTMFEHDRDAGKAFIRGSEAAATACPTILPWLRPALRFITWRGSWKAVTGYMEQLPAAHEAFGEEGMMRWADLGLDWCERHLESGSAYFNCPVTVFAGQQGILGIEAIISPSVDLFQQRRLALGTYLSGAIRVRDLLGIDAIAPWAKRGADILQAGRLRGEAYFRLESEESMALLLEHISGFRLAEHHRLFQLILHAWFGKTLDVLPSDWSPDKGRAFVETDGLTLYLPVAMPQREEAMLAVLHTAGHVYFHSYERRYIEALFHAVGREHPPLDHDQRITWRPLYAEYGTDLVRFQLLFDLCEDLRVDVCLTNLIPNYVRRLNATCAATAPPEGAASVYWNLARDSVQWLNDATPPREQFEFLRPLLSPQATIVDAFNVARTWYAADNTLPPISLTERALAYLPGRSPNAAHPVYPRTVLEESEQKTEADDIEAKPNDPATTPPTETSTLPQNAMGEDPDMAIPPENTAGSGGRVGVGIPQPAHVEGTARSTEYSEKGYPYAEWDYRDQKYKRNWAWVQEKALTETDAIEADRLSMQYATVLKRLKRALSAQKPVRSAPKRRQFEGDELDLDACVTWSVERRTGMAPSNNIYRQRRVQHRDTAVTLLADLSTSIMQTSPEGGRVVDRIRAGMLLFAESMEAVGDAYCMAGFASKYRDNVSYYSIKRFDQKFNSHARAIVGGLSGRLATRMGAAIRHAVKGFDKAPSAQRLLLILSDGRPADYDDGGDERYLQEDTRMAVKEALDAGVHPFCITLDVAGSVYLPQIFGQGHYMVLDHINDLPKKLPEIYLRLRR